MSQLTLNNINRKDNKIVFDFEYPGISCFLHDTNEYLTFNNYINNNYDKTPTTATQLFFDRVHGTFEKGDIEIGNNNILNEEEISKIILDNKFKNIKLVIFTSCYAGIFFKRLKKTLLLKMNNNNHFNRKILLVGPRLSGRSPSTLKKTKMRYYCAVKNKFFDYYSICEEYINSAMKYQNIDRVVYLLEKAKKYLNLLLTLENEEPKYKELIEIKLKVIEKIINDVNKNNELSDSNKKILKRISSKINAYCDQEGDVAIIDTSNKNWDQAFSVVEVNPNQDVKSNQPRQTTQQPVHNHVNLFQQIIIPPPQINSFQTVMTFHQPQQPLYQTNMVPHPIAIPQSIMSQLRFETHSIPQQPMASMNSVNQIFLMNPIPLPSLPPLNPINPTNQHQNSVNRSTVRNKRKRKRENTHDFMPPPKRQRLND